MKSWIEQAGFPMIRVERQCQRLKLSQQRFTYLPNQSDQKWIVPVTISLMAESGSPRKLNVLLDEVERTIEIDEDIVAYKVNDRQTGFYRVQYNDPRNIEELGRRFVRLGEKR
jgi:aminopeptidase N